MKRACPASNWPLSWKTSYRFDCEEIYGEPRNLGYSYAYANRRRHTIALLTDAVARGSSILDIAAAQGNFSLAFAELGYRVTWNDLREELADYTRLKYEVGDLTYAPGDAFGLSFPDLFDAVLITEIIEHVAHPDQFLAKVAQLVKPGGYVIMTTPNGEYIKNTLPKFSDCPDPSAFEAGQFKPDADGHIFLLHRDELEPLAAQAGLRVEEVSLFTNPLTNGHMKMESLLRVLSKSTVEAVERGARQLPAWLARRLLVQMGVRFRRL